ncbi:MAG: MamI family restriction endonuclease [Clostridium sp.]|nr:MamI family restriction endonuclease [Clostridium sp.]MCM1208305.1 MamI family restriction endonuclease [Ruminococcus sp.]
MNEEKQKTIHMADQLIKDLYLDLRKKVNYWSAITNQTPQARMGYIGQHLVSIVTGYKGGKSGARGYDIILSEDKYGEIKTCYRVDQLGKCLTCGNVVSSIESKCSVCNSENIQRNNDSKWLLTIKKYEDLEKMIEPEVYYFVLFEFNSVNINDIDISIWEVDPKNFGFSLCMVDYYFNIRAKSSSKAPFNMWPYQFKYYLTKPIKIYESTIKEDNTIETRIFMPDVKKCDRVKFSLFARASTITLENLNHVADKFNIKVNDRACKNKILKSIDEWLQINDDKYECFVDEFAKSVYIPLIKPYKDEIPKVYFNIINKEELD